MRILFADDEVNLQELMRDEIPRMGYSVAVCPDGLTAVAALQKEPFDCLLVDLQMPGISGIEVIAQAKDIYPDIDAVVMTGNPSQDTAIAAVRHGVFDYLTKPCRLAEIAELLGRVAERRNTRRQVACLHHRIRRAEGDSQLIGQHATMDRVTQLIQRVAPTNSNVLVRGETGCGKELVARALHDQSHRSDKPFVAINCGALPENLIESELFGHCRGAFTGADTARVGLFEMAHSGTLFLDEIGELPLPIQAKLLRVLETGDIRRVGDNQTKRVDCRVVCATHRNLEQMAEDGTFREDLMFRINTFEIRVPALRERISDLPQLAVHLLRRFRNDAIKNQQPISDAALKTLTEHIWPGNVRELANVIEHSAIMCDSLPITPDHLPQHFQKRKLRQDLRSEQGPIRLRDLEIQAIENALDRHRGNKSAAADELGVSLKTLYNKLNANLNKKAG